MCTAVSGRACSVRVSRADIKGATKKKKKREKQPSAVGHTVLESPGMTVCC